MKMHPSTTVDQAAADREDLMRGGMIAVSACFALSLLAAGMALPLPWLPGQLAIVCVVLVLLPSSIVLAAGRRSALVGLAASDFALRVGVTRWVTAGLLVVALPLYQAHLTTQPAGAHSPLFSIGIAATLCLLVGMAADILARAWATLQVQEWEIADSAQLNGSAVSLETAGRVNRGTILRDLWRWWMAGEVTLAAALLCGARFSHGHQVAATLGLLTFVVYTLLGLLLLSQAARARQMVQWRLSDVTVPEELTRTWNGSGLRVAILVMFGFGLFLLLRGLDVAHATVQWTAETIVIPLLSPLLDWLRPTGNGSVSNCSNPSSCGNSPAAPNLHMPTQAAPTHQGPATEINFDWLQHVWPEAMGILVLSLVILTYWRTRGGVSSRGIWREMLAVLYRDLRLLLRLLGRPTKRLLAEIADRGRTAMTERSARARHRESAAWTTPRQTIIGLYVRALSFAARRGLPRRPGRTPGEYADEMAALFPAGNDTFKRMTELFVSARYTREPIDKDRAGLMQTLWTALRAAISRAGR